MSYSHGRSAASAMVYLGVAVRIFYGMAVEYPNAYNAAWICPLIGMVLCAPLAVCFYHAGELENDSPWNNLRKHCPKMLTDAGMLLLCLLLVYDCAVGIQLLTATANFISLNNISSLYLTLPLILAMFAMVLLGPDAEGNSARIWLKLLPLLFIIVLLVQFKSYNPGWLTPVLGGGTAAILQGGLYCGGWMALLFLPWLTAVPDRKKNNPVRPGFLGAVTASVLLLALQMLCPALTEVNLSQIARAEVLLSNNRVSHILQMFMTMLWFGSMLHLICTEVVAVASFVKNRFSALPRWVLGLICVLPAGALSLSNWMRAGIWSRVYQLMYIAIGALFVLLMSFALVKAGEKT